MALSTVEWQQTLHRPGQEALALSVVRRQHTLLHPGQEALALSVVRRQHTLLRPGQEVFSVEAVGQKAERSLQVRERVWGLKACSSRDADPGEVLHVLGTRKSQGLLKTTGPTSESPGGKCGSSDRNLQTLSPQGPGLRSCFRVGVPSRY